MRRSLALVLVAMWTPATLAEENGDARFDAFLEACFDGLRNPDIRAAAIDAAEWLPVPDDADPSLAAVLAISRQAMQTAEEEDDLTGVIAAYGRTIGETPLYLVTTEIDMPEDADFRIDFMGCYLYDFAAAAPLPAELVSAHFNEDPAQTVDEPELIVSQTWNIEEIAGVWELSNTFLPEGSPAAAVTGFSGLLLKVSTTKER